ncbi:MAG: hypothetical protein WAX04_00410 [Oscillospiraceae bacterium]
MKKSLCLIFLLLCTAALFSPAVYGEDGGTGLPIHAQGIKEREYKGSALTDAYGVDILTEDSNKLRQQVTVARKQEREEFSNKLLVSERTLDEPNHAFILQVNELGLFLKPSSYTAYEAVNAKTATQIWIPIFIFTALAAISFFAALAVQRRKRRKNYVYNNYNGTGRKVF